ncbi:MAG: bifunctional phosphoribosylaminoimidazolecarboxamide formyltransferase/IMP cyclohydrolase [Peptococcaceae bacterium]|jgi:phosphoribosylaminoimidazolecarboxamide formyltransferase/IMP cyclohydrolase|nr:bifunctional phosphoribosylaminoimidazolecarboxamide formyltransferase/IMP cyclohydrolase [Peptococcaceae bacterium]
MTVKRALISVSDKTGVVGFARALSGQGVEIISTGGTYQALAAAGVPVRQVSEITGFPEILDGRVKTLHPMVHGGILALREPSHLEQLDRYGIGTIDLVAVNLYPFVQTVRKAGSTHGEIIENIDIGGPSMLRSASKNYRYVVVVVNPERYGEVVERLGSGRLDEDFRLTMAREAFGHTAAYDAAISSYLAAREGELFTPAFTLSGQRSQVLRYGENPHQGAAFYRDPMVQGACIGTARQLAGKELSYNNILDANVALELVREFTGPAAVIIKHNNPCGAACRPTVEQAFRLAYQADPVSAFGGIVAFNRPVDEDCARSLAEMFLEAVIAPGFEPAALALLTEKRKDVRLLETGDVSEQSGDRLDVRKVNGGFLLQEFDHGVPAKADWRVVTRRSPGEEQTADLSFAMTVVKHVKSNAIVVAKGQRILGVGAGQMNRVGSARIALAQAGDAARGSVLASDAFFPFADSLEEAARAGIAAIIQPGGSVRDADSIRLADEYGVAMVFTGMRHFKH